MGGLFLDRGRPGQPAFRVDQIHRVEGPAAVLALVAPGMRVAAMRAGAFDITVRQKPLLFRVEELLARPLDDGPSFPMLAEYVPRDLTVVVGEGGREQVE